MFVRSDGPTPAGGAYSIAFFRDSEGRDCPREEASLVCIHEYAEDGKLLQTTIGTCTPKRLPSLLARCPWHVIACVVIILFALFSCAGWIYETVENVFTFGGVYLRASLMLPWCPIYGVGGLVIVGMLEPVRRRIATRVPRAVQIVVIAVGIYVLAAAVELAGSYACEAAMGYVPWDYSDAWLNFDGRIAPAYTLRFVVLGLVALYGLYPVIARWAKGHRRGALIAAIAIVALFVLDNALEQAGVWLQVKDALVQYGINHW